MRSVDPTLGNEEVSVRDVVERAMRGGGLTPPLGLHVAFPTPAEPRAG